MPSLFCESSDAYEEFPAKTFPRFRTRKWLLSMSLLKCSTIYDFCLRLFPNGYHKIGFSPLRVLRLFNKNQFSINVFPTL
ncbi:hypothetical protein GDO78_017773 [Eleutherodactylus coqui]|uniref:Uncharacterized protein n=1 Tax=Eleutherodactylus coqui TaxID=57060 RepID=A0A8J6EPG6_ELECQ|nr:hypothetical protein GDO78_017773 [Eleutherodactylus coqui]